MGRLSQFNNFLDNILLYFGATTKIPLNEANRKTFAFWVWNFKFYFKNIFKSSHVIYYTALKIDTVESIYGSAVAFVLMIIRVRCSFSDVHSYILGKCLRAPRIICSHQTIEEYNPHKSGISKHWNKSLANSHKFLISRHATQNMNQISNHINFT